MEHRQERAEGPEDARRGEREAAQQRKRAQHQRQPGEQRQEEVRPGARDELHPRRVGEVGSQESREGEQPDVLGQDSTRGVGHGGARHPGEPLRLERHPARHAPQEEVGRERQQEHRGHRHGAEKGAARPAIREARLVQDARCARDGHREDAVEEREDRRPLVGQDAECAQPHRRGQPPQAAGRSAPGEGHEQRGQHERGREQFLAPDDGSHRLDMGRVDGEEEPGHQRHPRGPVGHGRLGQPARQGQHQQGRRHVEEQVHQVVAEGGAPVHRVVGGEGERRHRAEEPGEGARGAVVVGRGQDARGVAQPALHERVLHHRPAVVEHRGVGERLREGEDGHERHQDPGPVRKRGHLQAPGRAYTCTSGTSSR